MRDIAFLVFLAGMLPVAMKHPWIGALLWTWISVMNPHTFLWVAQTLPVAAAVAGATLIGLLFSRDPKHLPINAVTITLALFILWMCLTTMLAFFPAESSEMLIKVLKIQLMVFVTIAVLHTRRQINWFAWVLVGSLAFFGVKGGIFTLATGGDNRVWGPTGSFIEGNNELALALVVVIPLMHYLQLTTPNKWVRYALTGAMLLTAVATLGSHSRGALLAIGAMAAFLWWRSRKKIVLGALLVAGSAVALVFMPEAWTERMTTIKTYDHDESAMGRIYTWEAMQNIAADRPTGGGFDVYNETVLSRYKSSEDVALVRAAHSIYFQLLGEHGYVGLGLFILLWIFTWRTASWIYRKARGDPATEWAANLANMCQVSLVGYWVGGAFLSLAYFDLPYDVMILVVTSKIWLQRHLASVSKEKEKAKQSQARGANGQVAGARQSA